MGNFRNWFQIQEMAYRVVPDDEKKTVLQMAAKGEKISRIVSLTGLSINTVKGILDNVGHQLPTGKTRLSPDKIQKLILAATKYHMNDVEMARLFQINKTTVTRLIAPHLTHDIQTLRAERRVRLYKGLEKPYDVLPPELQFETDNKYSDKSGYYKPFGKIHQSREFLKSMDRAELIPKAKFNIAAATLTTELSDFQKLNKRQPTDKEMRMIAQKVVDQFVPQEPIKAAAFSAPQPKIDTKMKNKYKTHFRPKITWPDKTNPDVDMT